MKWLQGGTYVVTICAGLVAIAVQLHKNPKVRSGLRRPMGASWLQWIYLALMLYSCFELSRGHQITSVLALLGAFLAQLIWFVSESGPAGRFDVALVILTGFMASLFTAEVSLTKVNERRLSLDEKETHAIEQIVETMQSSMQLDSLQSAALDSLDARLERQPSR